MPNGAKAASFHFCCDSNAQLDHLHENMITCKSTAEIITLYYYRIKKSLKNLSSLAPPEGILNFFAQKAVTLRHIFFYFLRTNEKFNKTRATCHNRVTVSCERHPLESSHF